MRRHHPFELLTFFTAPTTVWNNVNYFELCIFSLSLECKFHQGHGLDCLFGTEQTDSWFPWVKGSALSQRYPRPMSHHSLGKSPLRVVYMFMRYFAYLCFKLTKRNSKFLIFPSFTMSKKKKCHKSRDFIAVCPMPRTAPEAKQSFTKQSWINEESLWVCLAKRRHSGYVTNQINIGKQILKQRWSFYWQVLHLVLC